MADAKTLIQIVSALGGKKAKAFRVKCSEYICRILGGNPNLVREMEIRAECTPQDICMAAKYTRVFASRPVTLTYGFLGDNRRTRLVNNLNGTFGTVFYHNCQAFLYNKYKDLSITVEQIRAYNLYKYSGGPKPKQIYK